MVSKPATLNGSRCDSRWNGMTYLLKPSMRPYSILTFAFGISRAPSSSLFSRTIQNWAVMIFEQIFAQKAFCAGASAPPASMGSIPRSVSRCRMMFISSGLSLNP